MAKKEKKIITKEKIFIGSHLSNLGLLISPIGTIEIVNIREFSGSISLSV